MFNIIAAFLLNYNKTYRKDIRNWAEIEYKHDADFAYNYMIMNNRAPDMILNR